MLEWYMQGHKRAEDTPRCVSCNGICNGKSFAFDKAMAIKEKL